MNEEHTLTEVTRVRVEGEQGIIEQGNQTIILPNEKWLEACFFFLQHGKNGPLIPPIKLDKPEEEL